MIPSGAFAKRTEARAVCRRLKATISHLGLPARATPRCLRRHGHRKAVELGCKCEWWGGGAIIVFDRDCPILDRHKMPEGPVNWRHEVYANRDNR